MPSEASRIATMTGLNIEFLELALGRVATIPVQSLLCFSLPELLEDLQRVLTLETQSHKLRSDLVGALHRAVAAAEGPALRHQVLGLKRRISGGLKPSEQLSVATAEPALDSATTAQIEEYQNLFQRRCELLEGAQRRYQEGLARLREELRRLLAEPFFRETLLLSSQKLSEAAERYRCAPTGRAIKWQRQVERSLMEHLARCCVKTSPRATLTAVHLGQIDPALEKPAVMERSKTPREISRQKVLLSLSVTRMIAQQVSETGDVWKYIVPRVNPTLHEGSGGGKVKFWRRVGVGREKLYTLPATPLLAAFIARAEGRCRRSEDILEELGREFPGYSPQQLRDYYKKLGALDVLRTHLEIPFSAIDGLGYVLQWLQTLPDEARPQRALADLTELHRGLQLLEDLSLDEEQRRRLYRKMEEQVAHYTPHPVPVEKFLVVDSISSWTDLRLGRPLLDGLRQALKAYALFGLGRSYTKNQVRAVVERLRMRSPGRDEIPALEAYAPQEPGAALWPSQRRRSPRQLMDDEGLRQRVTRLARLLAAREAQSQGRLRELRLSEADFQALGEGTSAVDEDENPASTGTFQVHLLRDGAQRIVIGDMIRNVCSGGFSRWAHLFASTDSAGPIESCLREYYSRLARTAWPGTVAGILFHSGTKTDTAGWHPSYHRYEIETNGPPSAYPPERLIPLRELSLRTDAEGALSVFSHCAAAPGPVFPVYESLISVKEEPMIQLLSAASIVRLRPLSFPHGMLLDDGFGALPRHLPRLILGDVVLSRETWVFLAETLQRELPSDGWENFATFNRWRLSQGLPRFLFAHTCSSFRLDKPHFIDAANPFLVSAWMSTLRALKPQAELWFVEMLPSPDQLWTRDGRGSYAHELMVGYLATME